ncbi:hypothetical protein [uncultured Clostridium sp.]|uniref:hypothetical protein n=1 Tax=uncultured Clostridium sp. TaxID=59620 RepID=UPI00280B4728|nr:hypothetical protein [uncultured Clostridium sp.]
MARPRKISQDELMGIIEKYLIENPYITTLKYSDLANYSIELGYSKVTYQDFSRCDYIKKFVDEYKKQKEMTDYSKESTNKLEKLEFNVDSVVDKNIKDKKQLKVILKVFKIGYDKAFDKLIEYRDKAIEYYNKIREQEKYIEELKEKNRLLRRQIKENEERYIKNREKQKYKWIYLTIKDFIENCNTSIESKEEIIDILKNFGYTGENDIVNETEIIEREFKNKDDEEVSLIDINDKVIPIRDKRKKLEIPDFMK